MSESFIDGGHHHGHAGHTGHATSPGLTDFSNSTFLSSEIKPYSFSTMMEGLRVNAGLRFAILFAAFIAWLYVIYWVRHHEPFVNQILGTTTSQAPTADTDRLLVNSAKAAIPYKIPSMGSFYTPLAKPADKHLANQPEPIPPGPGQAISAPINQVEQCSESRFGIPISQSISEQQTAENNSSVGEPFLTSYGSPATMTTPMAAPSTDLPTESNTAEKTEASFGAGALQIQTGAYGLATDERPKTIVER